MKRCFLIIVEGPHDAAIIGNIIKYRNYAIKTDRLDKVSKVWNDIIPKSYPFSVDRYDRISPVPDFYESETLSIAIKTAGGDVQIVSCLTDILKGLTFQLQANIAGVLLFFDADNNTASEKKNKMEKLFEESGEISLINGQVGLEGAPVSIPLLMYVFPNDMTSGNLEDLLLNIGEVQYPILIDAAKKYVLKAEKSGYAEVNVESQSKKNKAIIGCVSNAMRPGRANQVSLQDNSWISEKTISNVKELAILVQAIDGFIHLV